MKQKLIYSLERMQNQLLLGTKPEKINGKTTKNIIPMSKGDITRLKKEIEILENRVNGVKKKHVKKTTQETVVEKTTWVIDIHSVKYGYANKAAKKNAKKSRGSRKKMKRKKTLTLVQSVQLRPGLLQRYKDGLMGISPKTHTFRLRNTEVQY